MKKLYEAPTVLAEKLAFFDIMTASGEQVTNDEIENANARASFFNTL